MAVVTPARLNQLRLNAGRLNYSAPTTPHDPIPATGITAGPTTLQWASEGGATYDVYFGPAGAPVLVGTTPTKAWALPPLVESQTYEWQIIARSTLGDAPGPVWTFTAAKPAAPINPSPAHLATGVPVAGVVLSWTQPASVQGAITYDVYFGTSPSMALVSSNQTATSFTLGTLQDGVRYYWQVVARNGAGGSPSLPWTFETFDQTALIVEIEGEAPHIRIAEFAIRDLLADTPNTCHFTVDGTAPLLGQEVRIGLGDLAPAHVLFSGIIDTIEAVYEDLPANLAWRVTCQDHHYGLNRRKVRIRYSEQSATLIARDLLAQYAPSLYTGNHIVDGLPVVAGGIDFTEEDVTACFARLAQRIGGYWYVDYEKDVHLFLTEATDAPDVLRRGSRTLLNDPAVTHDHDLSQIRTRVLVEGGGSEARTIAAPGSTSLEVTDGSWYAPAGGLVVSGPQRIRYTAKGAVGGPAAPLASGQQVVGNLGYGPYSYVYTHVVSGVETPLSAPSTPPVYLPGVSAPTTKPIATAAPTVVPPPPVAPAPAPLVTRVADPTNAPTGYGGWPDTYFGSGSDPGPVLTQIPGSNLPAGTAYFWKYTVVTATGESRPSVAYTKSVVGSPSAMRVTVAGTTTNPCEQGYRIYRTKNTGDINAPYYFVGYIDRGTTTGPMSLDDYLTDAQLTTAFVLGTTPTPRGGLVFNVGYQWCVRFVVASGGMTATSPASAVVVMNDPYGGSPMSGALVVIPTSPESHVIARQIYRKDGNDPTWRFEATINDNLATTYQSFKAIGALGAALTDGGSNTTGSGGLVPGGWYAWQVSFLTASGETTPGPQVGLTVTPPADAASLTGIPTSADPRVTKRRIYRTATGGGASRLEATINDNTTTTFTSTIGDGALGAEPAASNTTGTGFLTQGGWYTWLVCFVTSSGGQSYAGPQADPPISPAPDTVNLTAIQVSTDARVVARRIYRYGGSSSAWKLEATINDNTTTTYTSTKADSALGAELINSDTTSAGGQILVDNIAIGPAGTTTARKLYRTESGGAAYKAVVVIADNVTTSYMDNKSDASLGGVAPGDEIIALTGIPASGAGAIQYEIRQGDEVNIFVQCDDAAAQAALAAMEGPPSAGIVEHFIQDRRLGLSNATATGNADLKLFARPLVTVKYASRDPKTRSGKAITIDLPEIGLTGEYTIQTVDITEIGIARGLFPKYTVTASSVRFSLEDVIRRLQLETTPV